MPTYVQAPDSDTWHWCTNCSNYPSTVAKREYHEGKERPSTGELDNECKGKEDNANCSG
jgi:hypothetical protein